MIFPFLINLFFTSKREKTREEKRKDANEKLPFKGAQIGEEYTDKNGNYIVRTTYYDYENNCNI